MVTHDQAEALALSDRVVVMKHGRIEQIDAPLEAYEQPGHALRLDLPRQGEPSSPGRWSPQARCCRSRSSDAAGAPGVAPRATATSTWSARRRSRSAQPAHGVTGTVAARVFLGNHWLLQVDNAARRRRWSPPQRRRPPPAEGDERRAGLGRDDMRACMAPAGSRGMRPGRRSAAAPGCARPALLADPARWLAGAAAADRALARSTVSAFRHQRRPERGFTLSATTRRSLSDGYYCEIFRRTLASPWLVTLLCVLLGVPEACAARMRRPGAPCSCWSCSGRC